MAETGGRRGLWKMISTYFDYVCDLKWSEAQPSNTLMWSSVVVGKPIEIFFFSNTVKINVDEGGGGVTTSPTKRDTPPVNTCEQNLL